ncbi:MAG: hypothetical protein Q8P61_00445 [Candidatus Nanopelagicales bacterium]|nr:hypothetical protein [Candidatus Nanopelagicales bacterium]
MTAELMYPAARMDVMHALACLADSEYQWSVWVKREFPIDAYYGSFTQTINTLFDDWAVLPDPSSWIGLAIFDGREVPRLRSLGATLDMLIDELGEADDECYLRDSRWATVLDQAGSALTAMVLAGGFDYRQLAANEKRQPPRWIF